MYPLTNYNAFTGLNLKTMKIKDLITELSKYPDDTEVYLVDVTTDDEKYSTYYFDESDIQLEKVTDEVGEVVDEVVAICFVNKLNPNPII